MGNSNCSLRPATSELLPQGTQMLSHFVYFVHALFSGFDVIYAFSTSACPASTATTSLLQNFRLPQQLQLTLIGDNRLPPHNLQR